jgi:CubicO group peptidase (beta-lactamase class C family)
LEEFASAKLFEPLGMDRTTFDTSKLKDGEVALPWKKTNESKFDYTRHNPPTGDSGLYSTATDLLKFANLFLSEGVHDGKQIFSRSAINLMRNEITSGRFMKTPAFWYKGSGPCASAFGDMNTRSAVCHAGFSGTLLLIDPNYDLAFAFISNSNDLHDDYSNFRKISNAVMASFT